MYISKFVRQAIQNKRITKAIREAIRSDELIAKLSHVFGVQFRIDRLSRMYAVINPAIQDGVYKPEVTFEYTASGRVADEFIKQWVMERLILAEEFIKVNNLFDLLSYKIEQLDDSGNHLLVLFPVTLNDTLDSLKKAGWELLVLAVLAGSACLLKVYLT